MNQSISRKRPWLAALLGAVVTGLGHLYLRRWLRAIGWIVVLFAVSVLFVDSAVLEAFASGNGIDPLAISPILFVASLSIADAYFIARAQNAIARVTIDQNGQFTHCPNCGKELDSELQFCHWCTTELGEIEAALSRELEEKDGL